MLTNDKVTELTNEQVSQIIADAQANHRRQQAAEIEARKRRLEREKREELTQNSGCAPERLEKEHFTREFLANRLDAETREWYLAKYGNPLPNETAFDE